MNSETEYPGLIDLHLRENLSFSILSRRYNIPIKEVKRFLEEHDITREARYNYQSHVFAKHYDIDRWTIERIAKAYNVSTRTVWLRLVRIGIEIRRRGHQFHD